MLELKGKYCKDCKIFTDNIEQEALSMVYHFLDNPMFEGAKIRIMPDVHAERKPISWSRSTPPTTISTSR